MAEDAEITESRRPLIFVVRADFCRENDAIRTRALRRAGEILEI